MTAVDAGRCAIETTGGTAALNLDPAFRHADSTAFEGEAARLARTEVSLGPFIGFSVTICNVRATFA
jgi:hypothetical protein